MYLVAIIFPPLAVALCGKPFQAVLNVFLWAFFIVPGVIHAWLVVSSHNADKRTERLIAANATEAAHLGRIIPTKPTGGYVGRF